MNKVALCLPVLVAWLAPASAGGQGPAATPAEVVDLAGDQVISADQTWSGRTYRIRGNLLLRGGTLRVENATVELLCDYARQYVVRWEGGDLETRNATIGGCKSAGVTRPTVFELYAGTWRIDGTTVQYSCGILFSYSTRGRIEASGLRQGENPDSIIVCGKAEVSLRDSAFDLALHLPAYGGATVRLDLPVKLPLTRRFDAQVIPGVEYRLDLVNVTVPGVWFLFFVSVREDGPQTCYDLGECTNLVPAFTATNLRTTARLPCSWSGTAWPGTWRPMPAGSEVAVGSLRVRTLTATSIFAGWGVYLDGPTTDVRIEGSTCICELMVAEGSCRVLGTPGSHDMWLTCTTVDVSRGARLEVCNANLAYPEPSMHYKQIQALAGAAVTLENVVFGDHLDLIAHGSEVPGGAPGVIRVKGWSGNRQGVKEVDKGGVISWNAEAPR